MRLPFQKSLLNALTKAIDPASLVAFRILFGGLMCISMIRFILKGWISEFYVKPLFHFTYPGFSWVHPWPEWGLYLHFIVLAICALCIAFGFFYRLNTCLFFIGFTYIELLDKTFYLNHYYAISLFSFLLIFLPLHRAYSIDVLRNPRIKLAYFPAWVLFILQAQIGIIYFFAGVAKLNYDWLFQAQPLKMWLSANTSLPLIGSLLTYKITPFIMSWCGALYDLTIPFFLLYKPTRKLSYLTVILFHGLTSILFNIGIFPMAMILFTTLFFSPSWPRKLWKSTPLNAPPSTPSDTALFLMSSPYKAATLLCIALYLSFQVLLPLRYLLYSGPLFWTEQGFRFSWRVMLMEKIGMIDFVIKDPNSHKEWIVYPSQYLTPAQSKMMSTQPDMILQFAHFLGQTYKERGVQTPQVFATSSYVSLNGRRSRPFINPTIDLMTQHPSLLDSYTFLLPETETEHLPK